MPVTGSVRGFVGIALVVALSLFSALAGTTTTAARPIRLDLNLGPGDEPYISGFAPDYEIEDKLATHWTTYNATVSMPIEVEGGPVQLSYRFARVFPETAQVDVFLGGNAVDHFSCRGGTFQERRVEAPVAAGTPVTIGFRADSHERRDRGLKMDWISVEAAAPTRVRLLGEARFRPAAAVLLFALLMLLAGFSPGPAAGLALPWALAACAGLWLNPWRVHRHLTGLPEGLLLFGLLGVGLGRLLVRRGRAKPGDLRHVAALALTAFVLRLLLVNHPGFYYPDLMTHARLVEVVREAGFDFLRSPASYLAKQGAWSKQAYGGVSGLPYSAAFHTPFALTSLSFDGIQRAFRVVGAAVSVVPLVLVFVLARTLEASTLGAWLMLLIPTYASRLSFALLPALFGHMADMGLVTWLARRSARLLEPRVWLAGALLVATCQLSYVSSVVNTSLLLLLLAALTLSEATEGRGRRAAAILAMSFTGSLLAVLIYYRDFLGTFADLAPRMLGQGFARGSQHPVESFLALTYARSRSFFGLVYPPLMAGGLVLLVRRAKGRTLLLAWLLTYLTLCLLRAKVPDVFRYGHETLFVTPLVCLAAGEAIGWLASKGRPGRALAAALLIFLAIRGFELQWSFIAAQLGNAL